MERPILAVTFDVTHTLIHAPRLAEVYAEVLARHGIVLSSADLARTLPVVWQEFSCAADPARDRFGAHSEGARGWWRDFLARTCALLGAPEPSRFAAAELFDRFAKPDPWEVYPDAVPALAALRERGIALGVISNWDDRLPLLLDRLALGAQFSSVVISGTVGVEKPHAGIFEAALHELRAPASRVLHVGDSRREDVEGAQALGMRALHLHRGGRGDIADLGDVLKYLGPL